jgi:hypothetical protein
MTTCPITRRILFFLSLIGLNPSAYAQTLDSTRLSLMPDRGLSFTYTPEKSPLLDVYVSMGALDQNQQQRMPWDRTRFDSVQQPRFNFRTGMNLHLGQQTTLNLDARQREQVGGLTLSESRPDSARLVESNPLWDFRLGLNYRW